MIVRRAHAPDAAAIAAIWNHYIASTTVTFTTDQKTTDDITNLIDANDPLFVAEADGQVQGFARHFQFRGGPGYRFTCEYTVQLAPEAKGRGLGRALLSAIEADARAAGIHSIFAGVSAENPDGVAFHSRMGFIEVGRLPEVGFKFGRWIDLVLMQKLL